MYLVLFFFLFCVGQHVKRWWRLILSELPSAKANAHGDCGGTPSHNSVLDEEEKKRIMTIAPWCNWWLFCFPYAKHDALEQQQRGINPWLGSLSSWLTPHWMPFSLPTYSRYLSFSPQYTVFNWIEIASVRSVLCNVCSSTLVGRRTTSSLLERYSGLPVRYAGDMKLRDTVATEHSKQDTNWCSWTRPKLLLFILIAHSISFVVLLMASSMTRTAHAAHSGQQPHKMQIETVLMSLETNFFCIRFRAWLRSGTSCRHQ